MSRPTRADAGGRAYLDLQNRAGREGRPTQELLVLYALERFLARLSASPHASAFVLKGGMLLAAFDARRATVDADLLATGIPNDEDAALSRIREVAGTEPADDDDGVIFLPQTARARVIREEQASIATATVKIQVDINFGDTSTRVRDDADIGTLTRCHDLDATNLRSALAATARHRGVALRPLSDAVGDLATLRADTYKAFLSRIEDDSLTFPPDLAHLLEDVIAFADPHGQRTSHDDGSDSAGHRHRPRPGRPAWTTPRQ